MCFCSDNHVADGPLLVAVTEDVHEVIVEEEARLDATRSLGRILLQSKDYDA